MSQKTPNDQISKLKEMLISDESVLSKIEQILTSDESVIFSVTQTPMAGLKPDTVVLTSKRFILYHLGLLGSNFDSFLWRDLVNVKINEGIMGAKLIFEAGGKTFTVEKLPKPEARKVYAIAQDHQQEAVEIRRQRQMQEDSAKAGHIVIGSTEATSRETAEDPMAKLTKLKGLFDASLITEEEYNKKKAEILSTL
jgi:hypothetical protein